MRFRIVVLSVLSLWMCLGAAAEERAEVPFRLIDGWAIVLEGTLGGVPRQKMLVDTGAVPSAINIKLAKQLGLAGSFSKLSVMNRSISVERVRFPEVRLGAVAVEALDMVAMDLGRVEHALGTRIDAVIGLDLLARHNFSLDYRRKELDFGKSASVAGAITFEVKHESGGTYILILLESGGEKLQILLDTGTRDLMLFERRLRGTLQDLRARRQDFNLNAGGQDRLAEVEMQSIRVGPLFRRTQKAYVWCTSEDSLRSFDGLLGPAALGATVVGFDFDRHVVSLDTR
jgi:predicted aspartyl protease